MIAIDLFAGCGGATLGPLFADGQWRLSSSSDPAALALVDGLGQWAGFGPHYSRRSPGSKTFTGVGREVVLVTAEGDAVWAVVLQRTPSPRGSGATRGRTGTAVVTPYVWRNMLFRNLGPTLSSHLVETATIATYRAWIERYGSLPDVRLRTEIDIRAVRSTNPGCCYQKAGWIRGEQRGRKLFYYAPPLAEALARQVATALRKEKGGA